MILRAVKSAPNTLIRLWTNLRHKWDERYVRKDNDGSNPKFRHYRHLHYVPMMDCKTYNKIRTLG
jgi:hypothetical protein